MRLVLFDDKEYAAVRHILEAVAEKRPILKRAYASLLQGLEPRLALYDPSMDEFCSVEIYDSEEEASAAADPENPGVLTEVYLPRLSDPDDQEPAEADVGEK